MPPEGHEFGRNLATMLVSGLFVLLGGISKFRLEIIYLLSQIKAATATCTGHAEITLLRTKEFYYCRTTRVWNLLCIRRRNRVLCVPVRFITAV